jgi:hypothetical protein
MGQMGKFRSDRHPEELQRKIQYFKKCYVLYNNVDPFVIIGMSLESIFNIRWQSPYHRTKDLLFHKVFCLNCDVPSELVQRNITYNLFALTGHTPYTKGADKSWTLWRKQQATELKKCTYFTYSPWAPHTYDFVVLTSLTYPRKILLVVLQIGK